MWKILSAKCACVSFNFLKENMNEVKGQLGEKIAAIILSWRHLLSLIDLTFIAKPHRLK
jgi:hypothetical protein